MKIPVFHDDQHGTAIVAGAALLNGLEVVGKRIEDVRIVCSGAGAAAIACLDLLVGLGARKENIFVTDSKGVIYEGRGRVMDDAEGPLRRPDRGADPGRRRLRRRRLPRPLRGRRAEARDGQDHGRAPADPGAGQPRPGDPAGGRQGGAARLHHRHRPQRLPEPGQQRPLLPLHLPRRAGRGRHRDQRGDEARLRPGARGARPRGAVGRRRRRLRPARDPLRPRVPDPAALRPAPDHHRRAGRGRGGDALGRGDAAARGHRGLPPGAAAASSTPPAP